MSKLDKLPVKKEVINKLAIGESQTGIAKQVGVNQSTISRFKEKNEEIIEKEKSNLIGLLPTAREYAQKRLHTGKRLADIAAGGHATTGQQFETQIDGIGQGLAPSCMKT